MVEEENNLVFVLIGEYELSRVFVFSPLSYLKVQSLICGDSADEVESLAAARKAALSGSEPSDSIRVSCKTLKRTL